MCCPPTIDEGRTRRTPFNSWEEDNESSSELNFNQFGGLTHSPSGNRPPDRRPSTRNQSRPRTQPVLWPGEKVMDPWVYILMLHHQHIFLKYLIWEIGLFGLILAYDNKCDFA